MDEHEGISQRDAALGLGLLGALSAALVGVMVFRIIHGAPSQPPVTSPAIYSGSSLPLDDSEVNVAPLVSARADAVPELLLPPAAPIATVDDGTPSLPAASTQLVTDRAEAALEAIPTAPMSEAPPFEAPRFIAPAGR